MDIRKVESSRFLYFNQLTNAFSFGKYINIYQSRNCDRPLLEISQFAAVLRFLVHFCRKRCCVKASMFMKAIKRNEMCHEEFV